MSTSRHPARLPALALLAALSLFATTASADAGSATEELRTTLATAGLLDDPLAIAGAVTTLGEVRLTPHLSTGEPRVEVTWDERDSAGQPVAATVRIARRVTGKLDIERPGAEGRERFARKAVDEEAVRQVVMRRERSGWRVVTMSAVVRAARDAQARLPFVDLDTRTVSSTHLSALSDLDELAVHPQTCAVTAPGQPVRVFVSGVAKDAVVTVFANGRSYTATSDGEQHFEAAIALESDARLQGIGVTVYSRASLFDPAAPADSRTWILPILVGAPPAQGEGFFGS